MDERWLERRIRWEMKKRTMKEIVKDVLENLEGWETDLENVGKEYFEYDRHKYLQRFSVTPQLEENDEIYWTDVETIKSLLLQMFLFQQQIFEDVWTDDVIDRYSKNEKMKLNEKSSKQYDDKKVIESFVWFCFSKLTDQQIKDCINSFKTDFKDYYFDEMKKKLPQDIVYRQVDKITDTIDKFVDKIGLSKNEWKKMLEMYK